MTETNTSVVIEAAPPIDKLCAALVAAQKELKNPPKTKTGQCRGGTYLYADLADVIDAARPVIAKHGLGVMHMIVNGKFVARLYHESGQCLDTTIDIPTGITTEPQAFGSWQTYMRRYSTGGLLFVAGEEDDDARAAVDAKEAAETQKRTEASEKLKNLAKKGLLKDASTGKTLTEAEAAEPAATPAPAAEAEPAKPTMSAKLAAYLKANGVTEAQFRAWLVRRKLNSADADLTAVKDEWIAKLEAKGDTLVAEMKEAK